MDQIEGIAQQKQQEGDLEKSYDTWEEYTPYTLKKRKSTKLLVSEQKKKQTSWAKLAETKEKWTEIKLRQEVEFAKKEHELRVAQMQDTHELQKQFSVEKHELEILILRKQLNL